MLFDKLMVTGPIVIAVVTLSSVIERFRDAPSFTSATASANVALVRNVGQTRVERQTTSKPTRIGRAKDGLFYVHAMVNGTPVKFVLDTGATMVVLTAEDAKRVGLSATDGGIAENMETAGGVSSIQRVTLDRVKVAGHSIGDVDAAVLSNGLKTSLLGQNLLAQLGPITLSATDVELR